MGFLVLYMAFLLTSVVLTCLRLRKEWAEERSLDLIQN